MAKLRHIRRKKLKFSESKKKRERVDIARMVDLATQYHRQGQVGQAENLYVEILKRNPSNSVALNNLGVLHNSQEKLDSAVKYFQKAISVKSDYAEAHYNLGNAYKLQGNLKAAEGSFQKAVKAKPEYVDAHYNLGILQWQKGELGAAFESFQKTIGLKPDYDKAYNYLGLISNRIGKLDNAVIFYQKALAIKPADIIASGNLGQTLYDLGRYQEALIYLEGAAIKLDHALAKFLYAVCLGKVRFSESKPELQNILVEALDVPWIRPIMLAGCALSLIKHDKAFSTLLEIASKQEPIPEELLDPQAYKDAAQNPLFIKLLETTPLIDLEIERLLIKARRCFLFAISGEKEHSDIAVFLPFISALALNCFINEYAFPATQEELSVVECLWEKIQEALLQKNQVDPLELSIVASYKPLNILPGAERLLESPGKDTALERLIKSQIKEPLEEKHLSLDIERLSAINDKVSQLVKAQYEDNPYPRWVKLAPSVEPKPFWRWASEEFSFLPIKFEGNERKVDVLIAGCGTGQQPIDTASKFTDADCLAVDLSLASLGYAMRKSIEYKIANVRYMQADILELGKLGCQFDFIESVGVLHHMQEPVKGWKVLTDLLRPNGLMRIGLYSELGRKDLVPIREYIKQRGYTASTEDLRSFRNDILKKTADDPMVKFLSGLGEFFCLSTVRDLLFHVQEHRFTIVQIKEILESLSLEFAGFETQPDIKTLYRRRFPHDVHMLDLDSWHQLENENKHLFETGLYQFLVYKRA